MQKIHKIILSSLLLVSSVLTISSCNKVTDEQLTEAVSVIVPALPDYSEYITLGDYTGIKYSTDTNFEVTDEDVELALQDTFYTLAEKTEVDRAAKTNDLIQIKYEGTIDGEEFSGSTTDDEGDALIIGRGKYPEEFENALIGMKKDETKDIPVTFPENYKDADLQNKTAIFHTTVLTVIETNMPEITDELVQKYSTYTTVNEFKDYLRQNLKDTADGNRQAEMYDAAIKAIIENATYNGYPEDVMSMLVQTAVDAVTQSAKNYGLSAEDFVIKYYNLDGLETYKKRILAQAQSHMQLRMALTEIAIKENIHITPAEFTKYKQDFAKNNGFDDIKAINLYYTDQELLIDCLTPKIKEWILLNSVSMA